MNTAVAKLVNKFDALSKIQQKEVARVIINRVLNSDDDIDIPDYGEMTDDAITDVSAQTFKRLDEEEAQTEKKARHARR